LRLTSKRAVVPPSLIAFNLPLFFPIGVKTPLSLQVFWRRSDHPHFQSSSLSLPTLAGRLTQRFPSFRYAAQRRFPFGVTSPSFLKILLLSRLPERFYSLSGNSLSFADHLCRNPPCPTEARVFVLIWFLFFLLVRGRRRNAPTPRQWVFVFFFLLSSHPWTSQAAIALHPTSEPMARLSPFFLALCTSHLRVPCS